MNETDYTFILYGFFIKSFDKISIGLSFLFFLECSVWLVSCLTNKEKIKELKKALENTKMEDIKKWSEENIGESLFKKRNVLYKEKRGNINFKKVA